MQAKGETPEMPPTGCAQYLVNYMHKIGFPMASEGYVKHTEITCWCESQGITLDPDEHQIIFDSFIQYNSKKASYEASPHEPAPYTSKSVVEVEQNKQQALSSFMQGMIKK